MSTGWIVDVGDDARTHDIYHFETREAAEACYDRALVFIRGESGKLWRDTTVALFRAVSKRHAGDPERSELVPMTEAGA